jgi:diguanylate cyclase
MDKKELRAIAEEKLLKSKESSNENIKNLSLEEVSSIIHDLQVHQIELEMQNEEMMLIQRELDNAKTRYFDLYDLAPVGYLIISEKGLVLESNSTSAKMLGIEKTLLHHQRLSHYIYIDDQDSYYMHRKILFDTKKAQKCELRLKKSDGTIFWVAITTNVVTIEDSPSCRMIMIDITERKLLEENQKLIEKKLKAANTKTLQLLEEVEQSNHRFKTLFDNAPLGYQSLDINGSFREVNQTWLNMLGYQKNEVIGKWFGDFLSPQYRDAFRHRFELFKKLGKIHSEFEMVKKNGEVVFIEFEGLIGYNENQEFEQTYCTLNDITERKIIEAKFKQSMQDLIKSQQIAKLGTWRLDVETNEVVWSEELYRMYGFDPELPVPPYTEHMKLFTPESWNLLSTSLAKTRFLGIPYELELEMVREDGSNSWMWVHGEAEKDSTGKITSISGVAQDITNRIKEKRLLEESEQRFKVLHDASFGGIALHDQGHVIDCNQGLSDITGYSIEELVGMDGLLLIAPNDRELVMNNIKAGYEKPYEVLGIRKNNEIYPLKLEARNLPYKDKQVSVVEFRDLTELKEQEKENYKLEKQWGKLVKELPLGFNIRELIFDENGKPVDYRFVVINDVYESFTGLKAASIIGKTAGEVLPGIEPTWIEKYAEVVLLGKTSIFEDYSRALDKYFRVIAYPYTKNQFVVIADDITERKKIQDKLVDAEIRAKESLDRLKLVMDNLPIGIAVNSVKPEVYFEYMNSNFPEFYGTTRESLINTEDFFKAVYENEATREDIKRRVLEGIESGNPKLMRWDNIPIMKHGIITRYISAQNISIPNSSYYISMVEDVTEKKQKEEKILYVSEHDFLTDLYNRRYYFDRFKHLNQPQFYPLGLMMLDVNGLKIINDAFGHHAGDEALITIGNTLKEVFEEKDIISRIGGDEFTVLLPNTTEETLQAYKEKLVKIVKMKQINNIEVSLAIGFELIINNNDMIDEIQKFAENRMYAHKSVVGTSVRNQAINAILKTLTDKYADEKRHSVEVSHLCKLIGIELKLKEDALKELEQAGLFHDIGKISIPDRIIGKPGKLTDEEFDIIKTHTSIGYQILRAADEYSDLAIHALHHHERWDGSGYPSKLKGEDIPLFSRIINVVDAYEAMTADRPYRKKLSKEYAVSEIIRCAGTQFDPNIAKLFVEKVLKGEWTV